VLSYAKNPLIQFESFIVGAKVRFGVNSTKRRIDIMKKTTEYTRHEINHFPLLRAFIVVLAIGTATAAAAATRHVSKHGHDTGNCSHSPCRTIGYAVGQADPGDTIRVDEGRYAESVAVLKQLTLIGANKNDDDDERENGRGDRGKDNDDKDRDDHDDSTIIDATGFDNGILISGNDASGTVVRGFTVKNATLEGILAQNTSNLTIARNRLINNDRGFFFPTLPPGCIGQDDCGEAIHLLSVSLSRVSNNLVRRNVGGILLTDETGPTNGNTISGNEVTDNPQDCGITLASHFFLPPPTPPVAAGIGGVYDNLIETTSRIATELPASASLQALRAPPLITTSWSAILRGTTVCRE
jgi:hypothetical protein